MTSKENAMGIAILKMAEIFGKEYMRNHYFGACHSYTGGDDRMYDYFTGFEGDDDTNKWTVFAYVRVDRETEEAIFLDYRLPDGTRMENPVRPIGRFG